MADVQAAVARTVVGRSGLGIVDMSKDGGCSRCGGRCGRFLPMTGADMERLGSFLERHHVDPARSDGMCPFPDGAECMVYEARPMICRVYTCRGHKTGEIFDDPRNLLIQSAECVDMQEAVFGGGPAHSPRCADGDAARFKMHASMVRELE